ncbi:UTP--glucose-1-phosphate uridylyltransferase [Haloferula chungangensis]|uniref:UTP--glucose-1-phosphate uridylyltransferase n=1 Tax=Haloferula chungangensis TaxID=1048331 RepID=A0ABW2L5K5_9BACT
MPGKLITLITSTEDAIRNQPLDACCEALSTEELLQECVELDTFRQESENLYESVRAHFFLSNIHRFHLPERPEVRASGHVPFAGYVHLLERRFPEAIEAFLDAAEADGWSSTICSALSTAYHQRAFQALADQVRTSVRSVPGNQWMFRLGHPQDQPLRIRPELLDAGTGTHPTFPVLQEKTPVRMDLTHSAWSDIFFLGMDFPAGARVINVSVDLGIRGRESSPEPPIETFLRVIDEPVIRLVSVDLEANKDITELDKIFDYAADYLGLLKAALVASGLVPPGLEGSGQKLGALLEKLVGPGRGIELASYVRGIPKGSRLAVSTNLLASLISLCMRATGQTAHLTGPLDEAGRRLVAARAILGEWLGGSGGGWQDSGGIWPGIKLIAGQPAGEGDVEYGISRGRLMPDHEILVPPKLDPDIARKLQDSLVVVHGGMAQNVGPILEMVTEKYLLRSGPEWEARKQAIELLGEVLEGLKTGDIRKLGETTTRNFFGPLQTIIPWCSNLFTERLISASRERWGDDFWGFWMLGGMAGGGMGFIFDPKVKAAAQDWLLEEMVRAKNELAKALPFAIDPVVYDFTINPDGSSAELLRGSDALLKHSYYQLMLPQLVRHDPKKLSRARHFELQRLGEAFRSNDRFRSLVPEVFRRLFPESQEEKTHSDLFGLLAANGFDSDQHEQIRNDLRSGRIGLAKNRLPASTRISDVGLEEISDLTSNSKVSEKRLALGREALAKGEVAVVTLAAGVGSRWTEGAGVVKALHPFCKFRERHRSFLETHLAKSRRIGSEHGSYPPHIFTASYLTEAPLRDFLADHEQFDYPGEVLVSGGRSIGLRLIPTERDLRFAWEELPQQTLDEQAQKVRESAHAALINWARSSGEGADYTDNLTSQCLHPVGHWYEIPNLLLNGTLADLLERQPQLKHLQLHNIDTLGANLDPAVLGHHIDSGAALSFEVITRHIDDRGGGLAKVNGRLELVEGLAMPDEEAEFALSYYNSMTTWIRIDALIEAFGLSRGDLRNEEKVRAAIRRIAKRMPTYVTLKDVKKRWGSGQEDVFPVTQFEKLWSDMTRLDELDCRFLLVDRPRGQQLKAQAQLDAWLRDGSAAYVDGLCEWG